MRFKGSEKVMQFGKSPRILISRRLAPLLIHSLISASALGASGRIVYLGETVTGNNYGYAVNDSGAVTGYFRTSPFITAFSRAYLYNSTNTFSGFGTLGGNNSFGFAINSAGQIAGTSSITGEVSQHAFVSSATPGASASMRDLGTLGGSYSAAYGINDASEVVGYSSILGDDNRYHAFLYSNSFAAGGAMRDLGTLGGRYSVGKDVNASGQVTGEAETGSYYTHAFLYSGVPGVNGAMVDLGTLGGNQSNGYAINDRGQVAGRSYLPGSADPHAMVYSGVPGAGGRMYDLGTLGGSYSSAWGINNSGHIVGASTVDNLGSLTHAFLYKGTPGIDGEMIDLDAWLDEVNPVEGARWKLAVAYGVSDTGYITGFGRWNDVGGDRAFLLDAISLVGLPGDADRDRDVDFDDLLVLAQHYGAADQGWDTGDFNSDGVADFDDLLLLAQNYGNGKLSEAEFGATWMAARSLAPEPTSLLVVGVGLTAFHRWRRAQ